MKKFHHRISKGVILLIVLLLFTVNATADESTHPTYLDVKARIHYLENEKDPKIVRKNINGASVNYRRKGDLIEGVASIEVSAPPKIAKAIVSNYDDHDLFFKDVYDSKVIKRDGAERWYFLQRVNVPVIRDREFIVLVNDVGEGFFWYYLGPGKIRDGSLKGGNVASTYGAWIFEKGSDPKKCNATFYLNTRPLSSSDFMEWMVPDFLLNYMAEETFPNTVISLHDIILHYDEWFDKDGNLREEKREGQLTSSLQP